MATPLKDDGRAVRSWNGDAMEEIVKAKQALIDTLGEVDPVVINRALRAAMTALEGAHYAIYQVEVACAKAAMRASEGATNGST